ncbi:MAG: sodium:solute symporter family protein [Dethiobacteria bacterium]|jgi:SSS family solute:Na+ symporter
MIVGLVAVYMLFMFAIGVYCRRFIKDSEDFLVAGRKMGLFFITGSYIASHFGGGFAIGGAEYGALYGIGGVWYGLACAISYFLFGAFLARRAYNLGNIYTIPDFLDLRYGSKRVRAAFALVSALGNIGIFAAQIMAAASILEMLGIPSQWGAIIGTVILVGYATLSGLWAVIITDAIQVIIAGIGVIIASAIALATVGGFDGLAAAPALTPSYFQAIPFSFEDWIMILAPTALYGFVSQASFQRTFASKDLKTAVGAPWLSGVILVPLSFIPVITGMAAKAMWPDLDPALAMPEIIQHVLSPFAAAIVLAALLAAIMSTADGMLLAVTAHINRDFYQKIINPSATKEQLLKVSYIATAVVGIFGLVMALSMPTIFSMLVTAYSILIAGCFVPVVGGFFWSRATEQGAFWSFIAGTVFFIITSPSFLGLFTVPYPNIFSMIPSLIVYVAVSLATKPSVQSPVGA